MKFWSRFKVKLEWEHPHASKNLEPHPNPPLSKGREQERKQTDCHSKVRIKVKLEWEHPKARKNLEPHPNPPLSKEREQERKQMELN